jgi:hypothetical protein
MVCHSVRPVTEPVPSATSPRRTVRVAVALVAGQAALCAVLGYLTFGSGPATTTAGRATGAPPPAVVPTARLVVPAAPMPPVPDASAAPRTSPQPRPPSRTADGAKAEPRPKKSKTRRAEEPPRTVIAPDDDAPASPPPKPGGSGTPRPGNELAGPVKVGAECATEGDRGRTAEGEAVRCVKTDAGELRWQIV